MKRRLRITVSVFFALVAVAFVVLWVRSYWWCDSSWGPITANRGFFVGSLQGRFLFGIETTSPGAQAASEVLSTSLIDTAIDDDGFRGMGYLGPNLWADGPNVSGAAPYWFLVAVTAAFGLLPWFRARFSLRTMLIATTLVAVVLGLVVWAARVPKSPPIDHVDGPGRIPVNR